uniref:Nitrophorin 3B n=1 Tax=Rhodnius prolixus TaxID=13249 RepID=Q7YSY5_RHOPR|nr:nitrophorin 3B [Rhodnius prolixus]
MEKFGAVIFFGLVMSTIAQAPPGPTLLDQCKSVQEKSGFNRQQFFTGVWFVTHAKDGTESTLCRKYSISENSDGKLVVQYGTIGNRLQIFCIEKNGNSQAPHIFNCVVKKGEQIVHIYEVQKTIVEKDGNSALLYRCLQIGDRYIDTFLVLNRDAEGAVSQTVKDAISTQSLNFGDFLSGQVLVVKRN